MKSRSLITLTLLFCLLLTACQPESEVEQMASDICSCMEPLQQTFAEMQSMPDDADMSKMQELMQKVKEQSATTDDCTLNLEEKYGSTALEDEEKAIKAAMQRTCPEIVNMMQQADETLR